MTYRVEYVVETTKPNELVQVFAPEDKDIAGRATYTVREENQTVIISVTADDARSLRAVTNAIGKVIAIFEDMQKVK